MTKINALAGMCSLNFVLESSSQYKLWAFISWQNKVNLQVLIFFFGLSLGTSIQIREIEEKHRVAAVLFRVSVRGVCTHLYALPLHFSLTQLPLSLYPPIWPARSCCSFIHCLLRWVDLSKKILRDITNFASSHPFVTELHFWKAYMQIWQWFLNAQRSCY